MSPEQRNALKAAALAATPQNIDSGEKRDLGGYIDCPTCNGDGSVEITADYCNYDGKAIGVQFYGIGHEHLAAEEYFRLANPAAILSLIAAVESAEAAKQGQAVLSDEQIQIAANKWYRDPHRDPVYRHEAFAYGAHYAREFLTGSHQPAAAPQPVESAEAGVQPVDCSDDADWLEQFAKVDGATAFHLIERHGENWADCGRLIDLYVRAKAAAQQPIIGRLMDEISNLQALWGLGEPGALLRHSDVFKVLVAVGKEYGSAAPQPVAVPEGYVLVPVEPTPQMLAHAIMPRSTYSTDMAHEAAVTYRTMLAAAPATPSPTQHPVAAPDGYVLVPKYEGADAIVSALYRRFKEWNKRGFGPDDVTWCEVKADIEAMLAAAPAAPSLAVDAVPAEEKAELVRAGLSLAVKLKKVKDEHVKLLEDVYSAMLWMHRRLPLAYKPAAGLYATIEAVGTAIGHDAKEAITERCSAPSPAVHSAQAKGNVAPELSAREQTLADRVNWSTNDWYKHVGAWEDKDDQIVFGSVIALRSMLVQFRAVTLQAAQPVGAVVADERAAFEKAMNAARFFPAELDFTLTKSPSGKRDEYVNTHLESCWNGWQARAALAAQTAAPYQEFYADPYATPMGRLASPPGSAAHTAAELREAAQAVVDRWDSPKWKDAPHTAEYINRLRTAVARSFGA